MRYFAAEIYPVPSLMSGNFISFILIVLDGLGIASASQSIL